MRREIVSRLWPLSALWLHAAVTAAAPADTSSTARTRDELFREVFKRPPPPIPVDSYIIVVIDGAVRQKMRAELAPHGQSVLLEGKSLTALLSQVLRPELVLQLQQRVDSRGFIDRDAIEAAGVTGSFDARAFEYLLTTAPSMRAPRTLYLSPPPPDPSMVEAVRPAAVSSFVNFNVKGTDRSDDSRQWGLALDGAVNVNGVVLEGSAFGDVSEEVALNRGDVRLVYDLPERALRFIAGDLNSPVVGYQQPLSAAGIGQVTSQARRRSNGLRL